MGFLARPGFSFFVPFFTVVTLGLRQFHSASATRHISFRFLFGYPFRKEREKKSEKIQKKKTGAPADCCHWKKLKIPHKYRDLAEEQPKEKERMDGRKRPERRPENSIENKIGFLYSRFILRKEKEEEKKKGMLEKGKKRDGEGGAEWLLTEGPIGKGAEQTEDKRICPEDDKEECLVT